MPRINPTLPADGDDAIVEPYNAAITAILGVLNGAIDADNLAAGAVTLANLSSALQGALVPTGLISPFGGGTAPTGWLMCDGSSYLRSAYSSLFAVIGTSYGSADGTHFNVPDFRGRVPVGNDAMGGTAANRVQHSTTITTTNASPTATVGSVTGLAPGMFIVSTNVPAGTKINSISGSTITMSANATASASSVAARFSALGNDAQVLGAVGGEDAHKLTVDELASHSHNYQGYASNTGSNNAPSVGNNPPTWQGTTFSAGNDQPHNNLPPSVLTNYIIKT
jgi:microcystin-dependent protein